MAPAGPRVDTGAMTAAAQSLISTIWQDELAVTRRAPQERLEEALGREFAQRLIAALVGRQALRDPSL